ncbi:hypothetical protein MMC25_003249 [Agyrium rufum]|nr:hypothetical protein [Agyrium rufum]
MATIAAARHTPAGPSSQNQPTSTSMHPFTCNSCQVAFRNSELQRSHMRSDWHRYNLKRRVASLPPLSSEIFAEKVLNAQASTTAAAAKAAFERSCDICQKTYYSQNAYQNHLGSQKHRANVVSGRTALPDDEASSVMSSTISLGDPIVPPEPALHDPEVEKEFTQVVEHMKDASLEDPSPISRRPTRPHQSRMEDRPEHPLSKTSTNESTATSKSELSVSTDKSALSRCLFCNYESPGLKLNILHMTKFHGLFIPEQSYLVDLEGLIIYLRAKISENFECILCHKLKNSAEGIQTHMRDKGHCMIAFDSEEEMIEIGQFYDFRSTYSDDEDEDEVDGDVKMTGTREAVGGVSLKPKTEGVADDDEDDEEGDGWETDSSASSADTDDLGAVPIDHDHAFQRLALHRHHSHTDPRPHKTVDGFHSHAHSHHAAFHSDHELHLPSGRTAGHRSLNRYYRQNLHNYPTAEERLHQRLLTEEAADDDEDGAENNEDGKQLARRPARGEMGMVGVSDARKKEVQGVERRERNRVQRIQKRMEWGLQKQNNFQKHFRDPLLQ